MCNKNKQHKTKRPKKRASVGLISEVSKAAPTTVRQVLRGERSQETSIGQRIMISEMLLEEGMNKLIEEVKKVCII